MDAFYRFVGLFSPAKRRRTVGPSTPMRQAEDDHGYLPISEPQDRKAQAALLAKIERKQTVLADTRFGPGSRKRGREYEVAQEGAEARIAPTQRNDGEVEETDNVANARESEHGFEVSPGDSVSQGSPAEGSDEGEEEGEGEEGEVVSESNAEPEDEHDHDEAELGTGEEELSAQKKVQEYLARQAELMSRKEEFQKSMAGGNWHADEIFLFERLSMRSFEPVFPASWQIDLPTLNAALFSRNRDETFFNSNYADAPYATKALLRLFDLGVRVKDNANMNVPCVPLMTREIRQYIKWSEWDGGYKHLRFIPVLSLISARPNQDSDAILKSLRDQMGFLAEQHREHLLLLEPRINEHGETELYSRRPPILYGIIIAQTMAIFSTLDSSVSGAQTKHIAHFDFKEAGHAVWNGMAVAIIVIMARNYLMSIRDTLEEDEPESDPDA